MRITGDLTDEAVLAELGARLARMRLERNMTQEQLAGEAGVGRATVERLEAGKASKLPTLIRVLRVLGLLDSLDALVPMPAPSPVELLERQGRQRRRASGARGGQAPVSPARWTWGDEEPDGGSDR